MELKGALACACYFGWDNIYLEAMNKDIRQLLPGLLNKIGEAHKDRPDLVLAAWPEIIGEKYAKMTQAVSFDANVLTVKVKNSTLHSLLSQHEKTRLLRLLQERFPRVKIVNINFRIG